MAEDTALLLTNMKEHEKYFYNVHMKIIVWGSDKTFISALKNCFLAREVRGGSPPYCFAKPRLNVILAVYNDITGLACFCYRLNILGLSLYLSEIPLLAGNDLHEEIYQHFKESFLPYCDFETSLT